MAQRDPSHGRRRLRTKAKGGFATRRNAAFPIKRALVTGALLGPLALFSATYSLAVTLDTREPEVSHRIYSDLPKAKVRLGDLAIASAVSDAALAGDAAPSSAAALAARLPEGERIRIEARALSGLIDTPYAPGALRQLAFVELGSARRELLLTLAHRSSRRDIAAAAQIAELQFADGELAEGLATLDTALTISDALDTRIFPLMLSAVQDRDLAELLRRSLAQDPIWAERLAKHASSSTASAPLFAQIANSLPEASRARSLDYGAPLVDRLATSLQLRAAFAAYAAYSDNPQNPSAFGNGRLPPLDWRLIDNLETGARQMGARTAPVELFAAPRRAGEAARIMLRLTPGSYALSLSLSDARGTKGTAELAHACLDDGRELDLTETSAPLDTSQVQLAFDVPADCPYQSLRLSLGAGNEAVSVLVNEVAVLPKGEAQ